MNLKISYRTFNSGGKGGQHSNRSENAVECSVTLPDGREIKAASTPHKSQWRNRKAAERALLSKVREALKPERERPDLSETVRTYHAVDNRVVDHASGERASYKRVVDKDKVEEFARLVDARRRALELRA